MKLTGTQFGCAVGDGSTIRVMKLRESSFIEFEIEGPDHSRLSVCVDRGDVAELIDALQDMKREME